MAKLFKLKDNTFNGRHPNNINIGYTKTIDTKPNIPIVGERYPFGSLRTSIVEDFKELKEGYLIETENSVYLIEE